MTFWKPRTSCTSSTWLISGLHPPLCGTKAEALQARSKSSSAKVVLFWVLIRGCTQRLFHNKPPQVHFLPECSERRSHLSPPVQQLIDVTVTVLCPNKDPVRSKHFSTSKELSVSANFSPQKGKVTIVINLQDIAETHEQSRGTDSARRICNTHAHRDYDEVNATTY